MKHKERFIEITSNLNEDSCIGFFSALDPDTIKLRATQHDALVAALREACDLIDTLGRECSDRVYDGERGNPVTADKFRAALAALDKEPA